MPSGLVNGIYLFSAILFIVGLKRLQSPVTAHRGNRIAALGMLLAVIVTLFSQKILTPVEMIGGLVVGGFFGAVMAKRVQMTAMPELVAAFNGSGGLASALVAAAEIVRLVLEQEMAISPNVFPYLSVLVGMVTFSGSVIAFLKLSGKMTGNPIEFPGRYVVLVIFLALIIASIVWTFIGGEILLCFLILAALSLVFGILIVLPIGGADMPVIVAFLNALSGLAAAATGFVLTNTVLIISGALVGASGIMLTNTMCVAMNRTFWQVMVGGFGGDSDEDGAGKLADGRTITSTTPDDTAIMLSYARKVIIVPGYGLAVAQAQHQVRELADVLQAQGVEVKYAVHPVAGRMPGHMNVLLAEANVPYDSLFEMDEINHEFESTDVALVIGANDVVNPAARHDKSSPIYGMPILNVDQAESVVFLKRSMRPGYSGVPNLLFFEPNTRMLFGDAKDSVTELINEVKAV
ncbi:MAG: NAD(P)(+) transhydrogenase (Re/Si-specific) subunit beta [Rhodothermaceae bacterium]|nr:NAD(P)(+) transhydrogenase (Re/Si-specific) subunit beta [Rhodothermaceae bacterium]MXW33914.1 NAD(P)(+) transhydrogenase (Re/Si-specific) subunit beta [Rhodothermaceae bacterium]MYC03889.1 NAD(P)(+) transhydrogenase (Re/Si-specific) subunit beta [Rhodothermaceae bacterium]MYE61798.1 NAD(P)(+) transhydrogenase (Re/Si-specific) subunit beta [Rhodothermaceae bacterium]MYI16023.1 NAD(P)(+) transhydrogenase (Re/Si-specific) subunit beta [Rhodothermaceae bacterium]